MILQPDASGMINDYKVFDIRTRLMDAPTDLHIYRRLVIESNEILKVYGRIVVCCSAGVSRSNSIAIALLMRRSRMSFRDAFNLIKIKVSIANLLPCHLQIEHYETRKLKIAILCGSNGFHFAR
jgi:hypothetical protein